MKMRAVRRRVTTTTNTSTAAASTTTATTTRATPRGTQCGGPVQQHVGVHAASIGGALQPGGGQPALAACHAGGS